MGERKPGPTIRGIERYHQELGVTLGGTPTWGCAGYRPSLRAKPRRQAPRVGRKLRQDRPGTRAAYTRIVSPEPLYRPMGQTRPSDGARNVSVDAAASP